METVAAVHQQRVAGVLSAQGFDHGPQRGKAASALERGLAVLIEELVVDFELGMNVRGVENGDVLRLAGARCPISGHLCSRCIPLHPSNDGRAGCQPGSHQAGSSDEIPACDASGAIRRQIDTQAAATAVGPITCWRLRSHVRSRAIKTDWRSLRWCRFVGGRGLTRRLSSHLYTGSIDRAAACSLALLRFPSPIPHPP